MGKSRSSRSIVGRSSVSQIIERRHGYPTQTKDKDQLVHFLDDTDDVSGTVESMGDIQAARVLYTELLHSIKANRWLVRHRNWGSSQAQTQCAASSDGKSSAICQEDHPRPQTPSSGKPKRCRDFHLFQVVELLNIFLRKANFSPSLQNKFTKRCHFIVLHHG